MYSSQILRIVDVHQLGVKSQNSAYLSHTAIEALNRLSLHADNTHGRLRYLWAPYKFKFVGPFLLILKVIIEVE
jgi:hypothetical protein